MHQQDLLVDRWDAVERQQLTSMRYKGMCSTHHAFRANITVHPYLSIRREGGR